MNGKISSLIRPLNESVVWYRLCIFVAARKVSRHESRTQIVVPILKEDHLIVVIAFSGPLFFRSVNDERTDETISILRAVMRVVPISPVLVIDGKIVHEASSWRDRALCDARAPIHPVGPILKHSVPMDTGCIAESIRDIDQDPVTAIGSYQRAWKASVDDKHFAKHTLSSQQQEQKA
jgi:hypothetical protein